MSDSSNRFSEVISAPPRLRGEIFSPYQYDAAHPASAPIRDTQSVTATPTVWVLTDDKLGHSTQSIGLADTLGWPYVVKSLRFNLLNRLSNRLLGASVIALARRGSDELQPPWPTLIIATGRRTVPVARWIRTQSGARTRLVQLGRKGADQADLFDLSVSCVHFRLPPHPRRIETLAPLTAISDARLREAAARWRDLFGGMARPHVALLVGGTSAMHQLDTDAAQRLIREVVALTRAAGGAVYVVTSPRTSPDAVAVFRNGLGDGDRLYEWKAGDPDNPYLGCLAVADALIATGDSESMVAETAATTKPLYIYDLPARRGNLRQRLRAWVGDHARGAGRRNDWLGSTCAFLLNCGLVRAARDVSAMHDALIGAGYAHRFGARLETGPRPPLRELEQVAARIRALFDERLALEHR